MGKRRYPGVKSFSANQQNIFFGRDTDISSLKKLILLRDHVLLYSESGLGKTSLLFAGVIPEIQDKYHLLDIRFTAFDNKSSVSPVNTIKNRLLQFIKEGLLIDLEQLNTPALDQLFVNEGDEKDLWYYFKKLQISEFQNKKVILVFDQFEELFFYPEKHIRQFKEQIADLVSKSIPDSIVNKINSCISDFNEQDELVESLSVNPELKIVYAIRSDRMSLLNNLTDKLPDILESYYELKPLTPKQVKEAIVKPAQKSDPDFDSPVFTYSTEALEKIITELSKNYEHDISTTQLQIVCQQIEEISIKKKNNSGPSELEIGLSDLPKFEAISMDFYNQSISKLDPEVQEKARIFIEKELVRNNQRISLDENICISHIDKHHLEKLVNTHLIKAVRNSLGGLSYELSHDTLVAPLVEAGRIRIAYEEKIKAQQRAKQVENERIKEKKRQKTILRIIGAAAFVSIFFGMFGLGRMRESNTTKQKLLSISLESTAGELIEKDPTKAMRLLEHGWKLPLNSKLKRSIPQKLTNNFYYAQERQILFYQQQIRHIDCIYSASFSPDGSKIVTASFDKTAKIWDVETGKMDFDMNWHNGEVYGATFSQDGKFIVTASADSTAKIWDTESKKLIATLDRHNGLVINAFFSPDGTKIVVASTDSISILWNAKSKRKMYDLVGHKARVNSVSFSPDGKKIITSSDDKTAIIWDVETGNSKIILVGHSDIVNSASFSPDGNKIVTASNDGTAKIWDVKTGEMIYDLASHASAVFFAAFSPNGNKIVTTSNDNSASLWNVKTGERIYNLTGHTELVNRASFSPDGNLLVTTSDDYTAKIWDVESGKMAFNLVGHTDIVNSASFSPDGNKIVTASYDKTAKIWDIRSRKTISDFFGENDYVISAFFKPEPNKFTSFSNDGTAKIYDAKTGKIITELVGITGKIDSSLFSPDEKKIATYTSNGTVTIWNIENGQVVCNVEGQPEMIKVASFSPDGNKIFLASLDNTAIIWDTETGDTILNLTHGEIVKSGSFSSDGTKIVTISDFGNLLMWDAITGDYIWQLDGYINPIHSALFSPDGNKVVIVLHDGTSKILDASNGKKILDLFGFEGKVKSASFSPDGKKIFVQFLDDTSKILPTPESIMEWLKTAKIYDPSKTDYEELGLDYMEYEK